ncbi:MAG: MCE family protein [Actinobacteria bacterium]|nr:MCE family protein [Actinomycetota bacterium]
MNESHALLKFIAFGIMCLAFSAWIVIVIGNISFEDRAAYEAEFADVTGLLVNDAVKVSGVTVGKITGLEVEPGGTALVTFEMDEDVAVPEDSAVIIRWRDVFGLRFLYLEPGDGEPVEPGHRFPLEQTDSPADLGLMLQRITPVMSALDPEQQNQVLEALSEALIGRTDEVQDLIRRGASLTQTIASRDQELRRLLDNAATVVDAYADRESDLRALLDSFAEVSESVAARNDTLEQAIVRIAEGQEELRRMVDANDENIHGSLDELDRITSVLSRNHENLERLVSSSGRGFVSYHRLSRLGQWFQIRAVGFSSDYETINAERGAELPPTDGSGRYPRPAEPSNDSTSSSLRSIFAVQGARR